MIDSLRKQQVDQGKSHLQKMDALKKAKDDGYDERSTSLQIKLNGKEAELERMENLLIEMHKKMDAIKEDQVNSEMECKEAVKSQLRMEKDLEVVQQDANMERKMWERQIEKLEDKAKESQMQVWRKDLAIQGLEKKQVELQMEIERLKKVQNVGDSVARLPEVCL